MRGRAEEETRVSTFCTAQGADYYLILLERLSKWEHLTKCPAAAFRGEL